MVPRALGNLVEVVFNQVSYLVVLGCTWLKTTLTKFVYGLVDGFLGFNLNNLVENPIQRGI